MNGLAVQRLKAAGWTPARKVDISPIEEAYSDAGMQIPPKLRGFFAEFGFLGIEYDRGRHRGAESHHLDPRVDFLNYGKEDYADFFGVWGVPGAAFPVGFACRGNMKIYYHENGSFYLFIEGGPLYSCGSTADSLFDGLIGEDGSGWRRLDCE